MRMHEDVRPYQCSMCDQTFRQKAHLQRHETTHGIGAKSGKSGSAKKRKLRSNSRGSSGGLGNQMSPVHQSQPTALSANLQERLALVKQQFGLEKRDEDEEDEDEMEQEESRKYSEAAISAEEEKAIAVQLEQNGQNIIELKDGEAFLAVATGRKEDENGIKTDKIASNGNVHVEAQPNLAEFPPVSEDEFSAQAS